VISQDRVGDFRRVTVRNDALEVSLLPELGGKLQSLRRVGSDKDFLLAPPERPYRSAFVGALFEEFDTSGFDECFPTIAACESPDRRGLLPDHGAVWSVPWRFEASGDADAIEMEAQVSGFPWRFTRRLSLQGSRLRLEYRVSSTVDEPQRFIWSAHPLLEVSVGSRILLPREVERVRVESSATGRFERGSEIPWRGLDLIEGPSAGTAEKLFTPRLTTGFCALHDAASNESIVFRFDPHELPFVGLWVCQGGWPTSRKAKHFTVALEPCLARTDALSEAALRGEAVILPAGGERRWSLEVELLRGTPEEAAG
jgi:galactose mutarotase-like enzyme